MLSFILFIVGLYWLYFYFMGEEYSTDVGGGKVMVLEVVCDVLLLLTKKKTVKKV